MNELSPYSPLSGLGSIFQPAYDIVRRNEGGYVNNPNDPGGETYAGIARRFHPTWPGWLTIDAIKSNEASGSDGDSGIFDSIADFLGFGIATNERIPELEGQVFSFYQNIWKQSRAEEIVDQEVANNYFDFFILSSKAVEVLQKSLRAIGITISVDNRIGSMTIGAINRADPERLNKSFVTQRKLWHDQQVSGGRAPGEFLEAWKKRADTFGDGLNMTTVIWISLGISTIAGLYIYKNRKRIFK